VALVMECWPEGKRPLLAGLIGAAANVGYVLIALLALWSPIRDDSWRWVMLVGAAPALLTFAIRLFVPESHRWEAAQKQAVKTSPLREIFRPGSRKTTLLAILFASIALIVTWGIVQWIPLWADQIVGDKDPRRKAMLQLCSATGAIIGSLLAPLLGDRLGRRWT
jgi:MFS family permease